MRKYFGYVVLGLVAFAGLLVVSYWGAQPRAIQKIRPSVFESPIVSANSILLRLQSELVSNNILFWGVEAEHPESVEVLKEFLARVEAPHLHYDAVLVDQNLEAQLPGLKFLIGERLDTKEEWNRLAEGLKRAREQKKRVLVVVPLVYAFSGVSDSVTGRLREQQVPFMSLLLSSFPRHREDEINMPIRCDVADHDRTGNGALGCEIVQMARSAYRKKFSSGQTVGLMSQVSSYDFLFLLTKEP